MNITQETNELPLQDQVAIAATGLRNRLITKHQTFSEEEKKTLKNHLQQGYYSKEPPLIQLSLRILAYGKE